MKIALVIAPVLFKRCPLIGIGYLSSYLKSKGHDVAIFDLNTIIDVPDEQNENRWADIVFVERFSSDNSELLKSVVDRILQTGAEIIGFSIWMTTKYASLALARMIKQKDKNRLIVFGGPECSFSQSELISDDSVDIVVQGEGEETFYEIAELYNRHKRVKFCQGAILKDNGDIIDCGFRPEISNLDDLPFPDFSGFLLDRYYLPGCFSITFYRGCARRCVFCNASQTWRTFRSRTAENIYKEMVHRINLYPDFKKFEVDDTALNLNLKVISGLCNLIIASGLKINWGGAAIIHPGMDIAILKKMSDAGCTSLAYGLESGSQYIIDRMKKGFRIEDAERLVRDTHNAGIKVDLNIIVGFPGETEREFQETIEFVKRNKDFISFISYPSECWFGNQTYLHTHPEEFDVELSSEGNHLWQTRDGVNNHQERMKRIKIFNDFINSLDLTFHNYATEAKKDRGRYTDENSFSFMS